MKSATAEEFILQLLMNFKNKMPKNSEELFQSHNLSLEQAINLASIVEKETVLTEEAPLIASVFLNRIANGMPLQSDPTVQFALGYSKEKKSWWKNPLTKEDLAFDSPYNTYLYNGITPNPHFKPRDDINSVCLEPERY